MKTEARTAQCGAETGVLRAVDPARLLDTALRLIARPSPTGAAGPAADELAAILSEDGFTVERIPAGHEPAPAVVVRLESGIPGPTIQFDGHLDTVHLPFCPPRVIGGRLTGSGAADMKSGIAAAVEALRAIRAAGGPPAGTVLFTAHDLHEFPWGDGSQLDGLVAAGCHGDAVLIPEYFNSALPVIGRGGFVWSALIRRPGPPVHEVNRPDEPSVIDAGARLVLRLHELNRSLARQSHRLAGVASVFVGAIQSGSIYNEYPQTCRIEGTRRWLPGTNFDAAVDQFRQLFDAMAVETGLEIDLEIRMMRDAFLLDPSDPFVGVFQQAHAELTGSPLPEGGKPFVDDGNCCSASLGIPAITHGPLAGGAHTTAEWADIADLPRVARLYALVAMRHCAVAI